MVLSLAGCGNRQMIDLTYSYKYAIISLPNGEIVEDHIPAGYCVQVDYNKLATAIHTAGYRKEKTHDPD